MPRDRSYAWLLPFGLLVFALVGVPLRILEREGLPRYHKLKSELAEVRVENAQLEQSVTKLERQIRALRKDPEALERIARDELGMLREGEMLFQF